MGGRFGKYGDIKRRARLRPTRPIKKKSVSSKKIDQRWRRQVKKRLPA